MPTRPRLTPAMADVRRAVRDALALASPHARDRVHRDPSCGASGGWVVPDDAPLVLVALSGGPDSLALAAALGFEQAKCGVRAGAVIVDHGLQVGSAEVAERAAEQARAAGLNPVVVRRVSVVDTGSGPEADARAARYAAFAEVARETHATAVLIGHTLDDQAETVLLGLARGSGARSLAGMRTVSRPRGESTQFDLTYVRPLLGIGRSVVAQSLADQGIEPWHDPQNADPAFSRVRVRANVLPLLEAELGPGVALALARTAAQLTDDADYLDGLAREELTSRKQDSGALNVRGLGDLPGAISGRVLRLWVRQQSGVTLSMEQVSSLNVLTHESSSRSVNIPGHEVARRGNLLVLTSA